MKVLKGSPKKLGDFVPNRERGGVVRVLNIR